MSGTTGATNAINIQNYPTNWLWLGTGSGGTHGGGGGPNPGILADPNGPNNTPIYITDENGLNILPD